MGAKRGHLRRGVLQRAQGLRPHRLDRVPRGPAGHRLGAQARLVGRRHPRGRGLRRRRGGHRRGGQPSHRVEAHSGHHPRLQAGRGARLPGGHHGRAPLPRPHRGCLALLRHAARADRRLPGARLLGDGLAVTDCRGRPVCALVGAHSEPQAPPGGLGRLLPRGPPRGSRAVLFGHQHQRAGPRRLGAQRHVLGRAGELAGRDSAHRPCQGQTGGPYQAQAPDRAACPWRGRPARLCGLQRGPLRAGHGQEDIQTPVHDG
mmetsp:Transcript_853/g.2534  ORF Transcript_853/g.2534 Transcript_853/m.2534 type:complete len:260 (+) Transcript_853:699-1478(+)